MTTANDRDAVPVEQPVTHPGYKECTDGKIRYFSFDQRMQCRAHGPAFDSRTAADIYTASAGMKSLEYCEREARRIDAIVFDTFEDKEAAIFEASQREGE